MILLQYIEQPNPVTTYITLGIMGGLILIAILGGIVSSRRKAQGKKGSLSYNKFAFRRRAKKTGLKREHIYMLQQLISSQRIRNPYRLLQPSGLLSSAIRRGIGDIELSSDDDLTKERKKSLLFQSKRIIENNTSHVRVLPSTKHLKIGTPLYLSPLTRDTREDVENETYESIVSAKLNNMLGLSIPEDNRRKQVKWPKGTRLSAACPSRGNQVLTFTTKVLGYNTTSARRGNPLLFVTHAQNLQEKQQRRAPRRQLNQHAYYYRVNIVETGTGKNKTRRAVVSSEGKYLGRLEDISAGGCRLQARMTMPRGTLLRIDFELEQTPITVFGKVVKSARAPGKGGIMHIMFTRISRKNLNGIESFVYGMNYGMEDSSQDNKGLYGY